MDSENRRFVICMQRNAILSSLGTIWPGKIAGEKLYRALLDNYPAYCRTCCIKDLYYLEAKGYVQRYHPLTRATGPGMDIEWSEARWQLTAAGNEVANRLVKDPALEV